MLPPLVRVAQAPSAADAYLPGAASQIHAALLCLRVLSRRRQRHRVAARWPSAERLAQEAQVARCRRRLAWRRVAEQGRLRRLRRPLWLAVPRRWWRQEGQERWWQGEPQAQVVSRHAGQRGWRRRKRQRERRGGRALKGRTHPQGDARGQVWQQLRRCARGAPPRAPRLPARRVEQLLAVARHIAQPELLLCAPRDRVAQGGAQVCACEARNGWRAQEVDDAARARGRGGVGRDGRNEEGAHRQAAQGARRDGQRGGAPLLQLVDPRVERAARSRAAHEADHVARIARGQGQAQGATHVEGPAACTRLDEARIRGLRQPRADRRVEQMGRGAQGQAAARRQDEGGARAHVPRGSLDAQGIEGPASSPHGLLPPPPPHVPRLLG